MGFFKRIAKSLFGSSRSSTPKKKAAPKKKTKKIAKPAKKKTAKKPVKKTAKKKSVKTKAPKAKKPAAKGKKQKPAMVKEALAVLPIGEVTHYFPHVNAAVVKIKQGEVRQGEVLSFRGHTTNFKQAADSMQIDHKPIQVATKGDELGIRVKSRVRAGDLVYKV